MRFCTSLPPDTYCSWRSCNIARVLVAFPVVLCAWLINLASTLFFFFSATLAVVRFRTERYGGHVAMHCHVNSHSDTGVMAVADIDGGEGPNEDPIALAAGTCG